MLHIISFEAKKAHAATNPHEEIVISALTKEIFYESNSEKRASIASLTKIVTAITAIESSDIEKTVTITSNAVGVEGSSIYLKEGEKYKLSDLLYGLMLRSGNDAATAIALSCSDSMEGFTALMNETALKAGAINSNFVNPHGLEQEGHYSTAKDLAFIIAYALKNPVFAKIVSTKSKTVIEQTSGEKRVFVNKNKMLSLYEGADGIKTGYTTVSGRCLASSATRNGIQLICVVLNEPDTYGTSSMLLDDAFSKFKLFD